ncbi:hypothetical protein A374_12545 [Fictibacillus macauensis ZFHKF-1]|uniref:NodB homology domain-containing protein n=1 Tax=Fictibacillus macauensis ZFHKF-1 TaxID=1196324 RepID=I8AHE5_9BACL|nr:polysaccharide deacetylase family protein [Fictibacillus macauensis]EIT85127.1 hypothetical protein A374_12545 [Fictibacillus macauensis ZFHKF-1]
MKKSWLVKGGLASLMIIAAVSIYNPFTSAYVKELKEQTLAIAVMNQPKDKDDLYQTLQEKASLMNKPPTNAVIDPVWKAIPGYNGLSLDVEASYKNMKKEQTFDEKKLVLRQTSPAVSLKDLPPAPIYKGNPQKPMVSLLVNVAWGNEYLPLLLETMKKHHVTSTFFLDGSWVKKNPSLAKMIVDEQHEIGNHAYTHPDLKKLTKQRITEELENTNQVITATLGAAHTPVWFAPPSGSFRDEVVNVANSLGMKTILWSVDTVDWRKPQADEMVGRVLRKVHPGAMILMHPTEATAKGMERMITGIKAKGYSIGTVTQLMDEKRLRTK